MRRFPGASSGRQALRAVLPAMWMALLGAPPLFAQAGSDWLEYRVKTAVIYKFTKFVEWPASSAARDPATFEMCVIGADAVRDLLRSAVRGKHVQGSAVTVRSLNDPAEAVGCHVLYITQAGGNRMKEILAAAPPGVLTVTETAGDSAPAGIINLLVENERVAFEINVEDASRARLRISSNLLKLARAVGPRGRQ